MQFQSIPIYESCVSEEIMRVRDTSLHRKFCLNMRKDSFPKWMTEHQNRLPREVVNSSLLKMFKNHLDAILTHSLKDDPAQAGRLNLWYIYCKVEILATGGCPHSSHNAPKLERNRVYFYRHQKAQTVCGGETVGCISHRKQWEKPGCMGVYVPAMGEGSTWGHCSISGSLCVRPCWWPL